MIRNYDITTHINLKRLKAFKIFYDNSYEFVSSFSSAKWGSIALF